MGRHLGDIVKGLIASAIFGLILARYADAARIVRASRMSIDPITTVLVGLPSWQVFIYAFVLSLLVFISLPQWIPALRPTPAESPPGSFSPDALAVFQLLLQNSAAANDRAAKAEAAAGSSDEMKKAAQSWDEIAPLVEAYRTTKELMDRLKSCVSVMESNMPSQGPEIDKVATHFSAALDMNSHEFNKSVRRDAVKTAAWLRSRYGLSRPALTDHALQKDFSLPSMVVDVEKAFNEIADELSEMIAKRAAEKA